MSKKKRLLILTDTPTISTGLGRICKEISERFKERYEVAVAGWHHVPLRRNDVGYHIYPIGKAQNDQNLQLQIILSDFLPDVFLCIGDIWDFHFLLQTISDYRDKAKKLKTVLWVTVDGEYLELSWGDILRSFNNVVTFSEFGVNELKKISSDERNFDVIWPGINKKSFYDFGEEHDWSKTNIIDVKNTFIVLAIGQNCDRKNMPATIEIFSEFQEDKEDVLLFMVTNAHDRIGYNLWAIIDKHGKREKVLITKDANPHESLPDQNLNMIYNMGKCIINTSIGEGFAMPLLEAQACGCIPITGNYASAVETVGDRGIVIDIGAMFYGQFGVRRAIVSKKSGVEALNLLYNDWKNNSELINSYKNKCSSFVDENTWDKTVEKLSEIIELEDKTNRSWIKEKVNITDIKLLQIVPSWGKNCGIAEYSKELIEGIEKTGIKVTVFPSNDLIDLVKTIKENNFNVVVFQHEYSFFQDRLTLEKALTEIKKENVKIVFELHSFSPIKVYNEMLLERSDEIIFHCDHFKNNFTKGGEHLKQINVVKLGCKDKVSLDVRETRKKLGISDKHPVIGSFGFMRDQKGYHEIGLAIKDLKDEYPDIMFLLVAPKHEFGSKSYEENFYKYIEDIGISDRIVIIHEYMEEEKLLKVLSCADMFVLNYKPNRVGGGNSAAIKTLMRAQRPIIVSDTFYFADLEDEVFRMKGTSVSYVKESIKKLYSNPAMRKKHVDRSNEFIKENCWDNIVKKHLEIYQ